MATRMRDHLFSGLEAIRFEPVDKRVRGRLGATTAFDSVHAVLVWEPGRIVPQYAVPIGDVAAALTPAGPQDGDRHGPGPVPGPDGRFMLTPGTGFAVHTAPGSPLTVDGTRPGAAFRLDDPDLAHLVVLDFAAFDAWLEEDEEIVGHARDPFHRVDVRRSSRHVRIELDGRVLADSTRPTLAFETHLPVRYYLPEADVDTTLLEPSAATTACAYKGVASYLSLAGEPDLVWTYPDPLPDARELAGLLCFFTERVDLVLDGERHTRPVSEWSQPMSAGPNRQA